MTPLHLEGIPPAPMMPRSFAVVTDLLQDTIDCSTESHSDADGELAWLRKRLENERREIQSRGKKFTQSFPRALGVVQAIRCCDGRAGWSGQRIAYDLSWT